MNTLDMIRPYFAFFGEEGAARSNKGRTCSVPENQIVTGPEGSETHE